MKSFLSTLLIALCLWGCTDKDESAGTGNIYGVVTVKSTAEPMRATGVELYYDNALLLKTVTYDDGHYEFVDLKAGTYELRVVAEGYADVKFSVIVEAGRTARADMQLNEIYTYMTVRTLDVTSISGNKATLNGTYTCRGPHIPNEVGFLYATHSNPSTGGIRIKAEVQKEFSAIISDLTKGIYHVCSYAKNSLGTSYGEQRTFMIPGNPVVSTLAATDIVDGSATMNGKIEYKGDPAYTEKGFVYSKTIRNPTLDDYSDGTKIIIRGESPEFSANITWSTGWGYTPATYYVRAYAKSSESTAYGESISVSTE